MAYIKHSDFVFDCMQCATRCDGVSKGVYTFENDALFSEKYEQLVIDKINKSSSLRAFKTSEPGYPDIEIKTKENIVYKYLEVKVQQRTFMAVQKHLPSANLFPSETVALNRSDLLRYFDVEDRTGVPTIILWFLLNRLCLVSQNNYLVFFQTSAVLRQIYETNKRSRTFKRKSGEGDVVDSVHKGVTVNYHFSLKELTPGFGSIFHPLNVFISRGWCAF